MVEVVEIHIVRHNNVIINFQSRLIKIYVTIYIVKMELVIKKYNKNLLKKIT